MNSIDDKVDPEQEQLVDKAGADDLPDDIK